VGSILGEMRFGGVWVRRKGGEEVLSDLRYMYV